MKFIYYDEMAEITIKQWEFLLSGGNRGGKSDWLRRFMIDGPSNREDLYKRQEAERETNPRQEAQQASGALHGIVGSGNFYMNSLRRELQQRRDKLRMELDMVDTALSLCTEDAERTIQLQQILTRLDQKKY